jgi:2-polyprenyl-6-methoxyphenol hydroxylase-like FAD-dependent oxidoreductase
LTAAAALKYQGLNCRIIDKAPAPSDKSKALAVWSRTLELPDPLGLAAIFVDNGLKINAGSMYGNGKRLVHLALTGSDSPYGFPLMIPQNETERWLTEHLSSLSRLLNPPPIGRSPTSDISRARGSLVADREYRGEGRERAVPIVHS